MSKESLKHHTNEVLRNLTRQTLRLLDIAYHGQEHIPNTPAIYLMAPHNGHIDAPAIRSAFPPRLRRHLFFLAGSDYFEKSKMAKLRRYAFDSYVQCHYIDRQNGSHRTELDAAAALLHSGHSLAIFPEGTRHPDPSTPVHQRQFQDGYSLILRHTQFQFPLIPVFIHGQDIMTKPNFLNLHRAAKSNLHIIFDQPLHLDPTQLPKRSRDQRACIADQVRTRFAALQDLAHTINWQGFQT